MILKILFAFFALLASVYFYFNFQLQSVNTIETNTHFVNQAFMLNSYLYRIPFTSKYILIDTMIESSESRILNRMKELGIQNSDIALIYHTHYHIDHTGSTATLSKILQTQVYIHPEEQKIIDGGMSRGGPKTTLWFFKRLRRFIPKNPLVKFNSTIELKLNEKLKDFGDVKIILTPGHTEYHTSMITSDGDCFVGDLLAGSILSIDKPTLPWFYERKIKEVKSSIIKLFNEEKCKYYFPGHGLPFSRESLAKFIPTISK